MAISPAPWSARQRTTPVYVDIVAADGTRVCLVGPRDSRATAAAMDDVHVVVAAPDLLDAAEAMIAALRGGGTPIGADGTVSGPLQRLIDAAAKGRGGAP